MKKFDKIIIISVLALSIISAGILMFTKSDTDKNIVIKVNNTLQENIPLNTGADSKIYEFNFENNIGYIETKNGKVRMLEMTRDICPKAICSETGWIESTFQAIICLPNKITVKINGVNNSGIDI